MLTNLLQVWLICKLFFVSKGKRQSFSVRRRPRQNDEVLMEGSKHFAGA
jgi:hypothetical protein